MAKAPKKSPRPTPRSGGTERGSRQDQGMTREDMERGSSAPGRSPRPIARRKAGGKVKKMAMGGKCRGMGAATKGGNFSRS